MAKKVSKNIAKARAAVENRPYSLQDAVPLLQKVKFAKFDETVDLTLRKTFLFGERFSSARFFSAKFFLSKPVYLRG